MDSPSNVSIRKGITVNILRNDGRVHSAVVSSVNNTSRCATVKWSEGGDLKGKELNFDAIYELNKHLLSKTESISSEIVKPVWEVPKLVQRKEDRPSRQTFIPITDRPSLRKIPRVSGILLNESKFKSRSFAEDLGRMSKNVSSERRSSSVMENLSTNLKAKKVFEQIKEKVSSKGKEPTPNCQFAAMIKDFRDNLDFKPLIESEIPESSQIMVCIRKRPLSESEIMRNEIDVVTVPSKDVVIVHEPKYKVDLTKYLESQEFKFDYVFDEHCGNEMVYNITAKPLIDVIFNGGNAMCFAYGQTGSGKTHTMGGAFSNTKQDSKNGIYGMVALDIFKRIRFFNYEAQNLTVAASFFEIYGGKVYDLLDNKNKLRVLEDGSQRVQIVGLKHRIVNSQEEILKLIQEASRARSSGKTSSNATSSRSHAVLELSLRRGRSVWGKLSLIDLAGNERGGERGGDRREEGAEINRSLLALKECVRALGRGGRQHLPFRGSTLTQVLRDSLLNARTVMIATLSPGSRSCDHSLNTLRYAARVRCLHSAPASTLSALPNTSGRTAPGSFLPSSNEGSSNDLSSCDDETVSQLEKFQENVLDGFETWMNNRIKWDIKESDLWSKKQYHDLDRDTFSSELLVVIKEQKECLNQLEKKVKTFLQYKTLNHK